MSLYKVKIIFTDGDKCATYVETEHITNVPNLVKEAFSHYTYTILSIKLITETKIIRRPE